MRQSIEKFKKENRIYIKKSPTADTRTCDYKNVTKGVLKDSTFKHRSDVMDGMKFFEDLLSLAAHRHDDDKITDIATFHNDFVTGFKNTEWWDKHKLLNRHHLTEKDGIPDDVNLVDVLEYITDCVMAGMARSGSVYELKLDSDLLQKAFKNTVELLKNQVEVS